VLQRIRLVSYPRDKSIRTPANGFFRLSLKMNKSILKKENQTKQTVFEYTAMYILFVAPDCRHRVVIIINYRST